jgi:anion-transporting  ArsA/GET3 family ATPase
MKITIFAGKGGVGKSTVSGMFALLESIVRGKKTLLADNDGKRAHSSGKVMNFERKKYVGNFLNKTEIDTLYISFINGVSYKSISYYQARGKPVQEYLAQFPDDYGLVAICDMVTTFFGIPTDTVTISKFLSLVNVYHQAEAAGIESMIIDMEPTEGLERLINNVKVVVRSLRNLQKGSLMQTAIGKKYKEIGAFFKSPYIKNADKYVERMEKTTNDFKAANFVLVSIPESSPVEQMFELEKLINSIDASASAYVINNYRGMEYEKKQIDRVVDYVDGITPVVVINHDANLCDSESKIRVESLIKAGSGLSIID